MYYHVIVDIEDKTHWWADHTYDRLIQEILRPFINKQVVPVNYKNGKGIFNFGTANYLRVFKTSEPLESMRGDELYTDSFQKYECTEEIIEQFLVTNSAVESKSLLQKLFLPTKSQVFTIMQFNDKTLDSAYEGVVKPTVKKFKYEPLRIDEIQDSGRINDQILEEIAQSEIVLADLTGERPNCYYEAGFAHAIGKEIIFTVRQGSVIHFDLAAHRFIEWETEADLRRQLQKRFKAIVQRKQKK